MPRFQNSPFCNSSLIPSFTDSSCLLLAHRLVEATVRQHLGFQSVSLLMAEAE